MGCFRSSLDFLAVRVDIKIDVRVEAVTEAKRLASCFPVTDCLETLGSLRTANI